ncbi:hypothetical protein EV426DRAFT_713385 [Tirmania nivea]|nr:hypothetical protein EV426DRAFT_713385 [Tirmania nivea]
MGQRVISYNEDTQGAWVELESEQVIKGDIAVVADGLRSRAKKAIFQSHNLSIGTGKERGAGGMWKERGRGIRLIEHGLTGIGMWGGWERMCISCGKFARREEDPVGLRRILFGRVEDDQDGEDWKNPVPVRAEQAMQFFERWDPVAKAVVKLSDIRPFSLSTSALSPGTLPIFSSKNSHIILLDDAAHPFLPTAIQGATQAMEDGVVLATYLSLSHFSLYHGTLSTPEKAAIADEKGGLEAKEKEKPKNMEPLREEWLLGQDGRERYGRR